jgi:hypothetical protein
VSACSSHRGHLGSIAVLTDENGNFAERNSYDPWGKRRFPAADPRLHFPLPCL